ncbi:MAG: Holliday junction branch migration DNA helicase RuvB [Candidatus Ancillula sp.]|jgi:Holliday junction DNA helicase RuvB|nr:Holliday junction branch migration DNA helicase RuvB [Candidatus Ancillula sp.]
MNDSPLTTTDLNSILNPQADQVFFSEQINGKELSEKAIESTLRPQNLSEFVGQKQVVEQLQVLLKSAQKRKDFPDHILFAGPPGLGKTTLSMIVAKEMETDLKITSGPSLTHAGDLAAILSSLQEGEILFIDEIHRLAKSVQEMLYIAMEDFRVDVVVGKGIGSSSIALPLPKFTVVGATTRAGLLPGPLRDRFGFTAQMEFYTPEELQKIILASAIKLNILIDSDASLEIANRSRGTARIANRLLRRVRDWKEVNSTQHKSISLQDAKNALLLYQVDNLGLDYLDKKVLLALENKFSGGPVGIKTLASSISEETDTIEEVAEPFLVRLGFMSRTSRGRIITQKGQDYILNQERQ